MNTRRKLFLFGGGGLTWTPASLFAQGEEGVWYEPKPQYLFQDANGNTPVTGDGQPVGLMLDRSGNENHATQPTAASRPLYRTDGVLHWLEFDEVDDYLKFEMSLISNQVLSVHAAINKTGSSTSALLSNGSHPDSGALELFAPSAASDIDLASNGLRTPTFDFPNNSNYILQGSVDRSIFSINLFINSTNQFTDTDSPKLPVTYNNPWYMGTRHNISGYYGGRVYGLIFIDSELTYKEEIYEYYKQMGIEL